MADEQTPAALVVRDASLTAQDGRSDASAPQVVAAGPAAPVRRAVPAMLQASAEAFGDVVHALLCDLEQVSNRVQGLGWLALTPGLLDSERGFQQSAQQLQQWEQFLAELPNPHLFSERMKQQVDQLKRLHAGATLRGRQDALRAHQHRVTELLARHDITPGQRAALSASMDDPDNQGWTVDPQPWVDAELAQLPPLPVVIPILASDLDPVHNAAGYNAVMAMRGHPSLAPLAQQLDVALSQILRQEFKLPKAAAKGHAWQLTGVFLIALRRALSAGDTQLATSLRFMVQADQQRLSEQFGEELLRSWLHHLGELPLPKAQLSVGQRLKGLLGMKPRATPPAGSPTHQLESRQPRLLTDGE